MSSGHTGQVQPSIDLEEHRSKNVNAKAVVAHGYIPGTDQYVPITAVDNGDGTYSLSTPTSTGSAAKPTDAYSIQAISETATYKYFYFEDSSANWYILRKTLATSVFDYAKGTGGYASVYTNATSDPSGGSFASYGVTF